MLRCSRDELDFIKGRWLSISSSVSYIICFADSWVVRRASQIQRTTWRLKYIPPINTRRRSPGSELKTPTGHQPSYKVESVCPPLVIPPKRLVPLCSSSSQAILRQRAEPSRFQFVSIYRESSLHIVHVSKAAQVVCVEECGRDRVEVVRLVARVVDIRSVINVRRLPIRTHVTPHIPIQG